MSPEIEDVMFDVKIDRLNAVLVDHFTHAQVYHVCGSDHETVIGALSRTIDLNKSSIINISQDGGFCKEYSHLYKLGYRISGIEKNGGRVVVRKVLHCDYDQLCLTIKFDAEWIANTWKRLDAYLNA